MPSAAWPSHKEGTWPRFPRPSIINSSSVRRRSRSRRIGVLVPILKVKGRSVFSRTVRQGRSEVSAFLLNAPRIGNEYGRVSLFLGSNHRREFKGGDRLRFLLLPVTPP